MVDLLVDTFLNVLWDILECISQVKRLKNGQRQGKQRHEEQIRTTHVGIVWTDIYEGDLKPTDTKCMKKTFQVF